MFSFAIPLDPVPASRPRVTRWGTFYAKNYGDWLKAAPAYVPSVEQPLCGPVAVSLLFVCKKPKTGKRDWPRGDIDNYAKGVLDTMTKAGIWHDDDQVTTATIRKRYAQKGEQPHIQITATEDQEYGQP